MTTKEHLDKAYEHSYYTVLGCGGDLSDWREGYNNLIKEKVDPNFDMDKEDIFFFTGKDMNDKYKLKGTTAYQDDLTIMAFSYNTCKNIGGLAMFKMRMQDRWFDDIVDNNKVKNSK